MNKTTTQKAGVLLHVSECENILQSQLSVIGILKKLFLRNVSVMTFLFVAIFQFLLLQNATAQNASQNVTIKGTVLDDGDNNGVPGVSIIDNNRKMLGLTDAKGDFTISIAKGTTVSFSMIGYAAISKTFTDGQTGVNIRLKSSTNELNTVVVTALGIKRDQKALGYATTTVDGEQLTNAIANNWTSALSGKVAGLNLIKSGGGPAGSNKIILRGENSLAGESEALIVIDGVITSGSSGRRSTGSGSGAYLSGDSPTDFGNSLADINPDDIESVSVLKGPAATALYGSRGGNGAVIITTKSGKVNQKGIGVSFNSNSSFETISRWPDYQNEYGQGATGQDLYYSYLATADGASTRSTSSAWGPKFDGQSYFQYDPVTKTTSATRLPWVAYPNNHKDFFQTANTFINSVALDGGTDKTTARLSVTNLQNRWIIPNTGMTRNTISLSVSSKLTNKLQIASKVNYTNKYSDNLPSTGYNNQSIMYFIRGLTPNMNMDWFKEYWMPGQEGIMQNRPFSSLLDNPYLIANEMLNKSNRNNVVGNVSATYNFLKNLSLMVRTSVDLSYEGRSQQRPFNTNKYANGMYRTQNIFSQEINSDFLLRYNDKVGSKFDYTVTLGGSRMKNRYTVDELRADQLLYPGIFSFANSKNTLITLPNRQNYAVNSFYALGTASYDNFLFLDLTARNDWASTLATPTGTDNVSFFYPSASLSAVLSDKIKFPKQISYLKLRASVAGVGSGSTKPYQTAYAYTPTGFPGSLVNPTVIANTELRPLKTSSVELGLDLKLFKNRLGIDFAVYQNNTKDQIIPSRIDASSGYSSVILNIGEVRNKGLEVQLNASPLKSKSGLNINLFGTFATNRNKVISLSDSVGSLVLSSGPRGTIEARVGGAMGDIYGLGYERSPDGQIVYKDGIPVLGQTTQYLGNSTARYKSSLGTTISYKRFSLNLLFDAQFGGKAYSLTHAVLAEEGKLQKTVPGRYNGIVGNGVMLKDGVYVPNTIVATNIQAYYNGHFNRDNVESNLFSTDFIKFREARLDYALTPKFTSKLGLQKATIGIYGRDLLMFTDWPAFDPEFGTIGADGDISAGFESAQFPSTRTFGINLTIAF
ncbi:SusC/RagA family TonB-linked outer membrane protein [Pedobacter xixiisoli]|uniref:TonB-linked outer membrane protein, SusC/RagA family n=1 Tax=Pedobacter xixiisoli TaxID=1476464 RepID=A0A285ZRN2_9SPHI|nr:SusC/RagA family TonB-linked outer membrane protein [Pedobacter xixiisoli]SOD12314.1 TonB-linked outer membrane protein, SusC/RagA family [Pedobacter xixiisoli]